MPSSKEFRLPTVFSLTVFVCGAVLATPSGAVDQNARIVGTVKPPVDMQKIQIPTCPPYDTCNNHELWHCIGETSHYCAHAHRRCQNTHHHC
jgi:hypothetical protein